MPIFLLAVSQVKDINIYKAIFAFIIIHLLVYPASNGYNSYIDKDEESIGGIEKPPLPTQQLFYVTLILDVLSIIISIFFVNINFALAILMYVIASRAYSSKQIRLKKYPILGFLVVTIFQGGFTYFMSTLGITNSDFIFSPENGFILMASSLQIAGAYPLTQIYQHQQDLKDGVKTISYKLGYKGTFLFTAIMFGLCNLFYYFYFNSQNQLKQFYILQLFFLPIVIFFSSWFLKVLKNSNQANYKNTMRMNIIASLCMNGCFGILIILNKLN
ncbi:MAG: UbiA family prenyltransferase [Bacteroidota bacterium]|nr:UbiA family prenyltransferase [Bacteroidota bacterium]